MGNFEDAVNICIALIMIVLVPWGTIAYPAMVQRFMGDYGPANLLVEQGFHLVAYITIALILLILLIGVWLD